MALIVTLIISLSTGAAAREYAAPMAPEKQESLELFMNQWVKKVGRENAKALLKSDTTERRRFLADLRKTMKALGLSVPQLDSDFTIKTPCIVGFVLDENCFSGVDIVEKNMRYCLPCIEPHNQIFWGIDKSDRIFIQKPPPRILENTTPVEGVREN